MRRTLRFGGGLSLEEVIIAHALGRELACSRTAEASGVLMIPVPRGGVLRAIDGLEDGDARAGRSRGDDHGTPR